MERKEVIKSKMGNDMEKLNHGYNHHHVVKIVNTIVSLRQKKPQTSLFWSILMRMR